MKWNEKCFIIKFQNWLVLKNIEKKKKFKQNNFGQIILKLIKATKQQKKKRLYSSTTKSFNF